MEINILDEQSQEIRKFFRVLNNMFDTAETLIREHQPSLTGERYIGNKEVSELLHLAPRTLQDYRDKRVLPYIKLGNRILYKESDVIRMLEENYFDSIT
jgi:hypothetical protein